MPCYQTLMAMGPSVSRAVASRKACMLYRAIIKQLPHAFASNEMDYDLKRAKSIIRQKFYANANLTDLAVIDRVLYQSAMEVDEVMEQWSRIEDVQEIFDPLEPNYKVAMKKEGSDPIDRFLAGVDNI
ncbi:hypothetical protein WA158_004208 [Blastocystis sp. Blastoise]